MNRNEIFQIDPAQCLSDMFNHTGEISIHAGNLRYIMKPGSTHYEQLKFLLSEFGCDFIAQKHLGEGTTASSPG